MLKTKIASFLSIFIVLTSTTIFISPSFALTYQIPTQGNVIGEYQELIAKKGDNLLNIAEKYGIGVADILTANPHLTHRHFSKSTKVIIPSQFILPPGDRTGIVINLANKRLYFFRPNQTLVTTYPVGVGRQGWSTPLGETQIVSKQEHPDWHPTPSIRREAEENGHELPLVIPAGPDNPLGQYAIRLGFAGIMIHGTNNPHSVGLQVSHGCIRLYANDIKELFHLTSIGTPVRIIYAPSSNSLK